MKIEQRVMMPADGAWFLDLNNSEVPHVNNLDQEALNGLLSEADLSLVIEVDGKPAAGLITFAPGAGYASANYRWYSDNYDAFLYIDRIVVDPAQRGHGLARQLYDQAWGRARAKARSTRIRPTKPRCASTNGSDSSRSEASRPRAARRRSSCWRVCRETTPTSDGF